LDAAVSLYEQNATYVLDSGEVITGRSAIRETAKGFLALKPKFTIEAQALLNGDEDLALTSSTWSVTGTDAEGKTLSVNGKAAR
jgi:hypothetical protein